MTCGIVGYGPKILDPEKDAEYSRAFINHLKPLLIEIYCNGYDTFYADWDEDVKYEQQKQF